MHKHLTITAYVCLATYLPLFAIAGPAAEQQTARSKEASDQDATDKKSSDAESAPKKSSGRSKTAKKKTARVSAAKKSLERASAAKKVPERDTGLGMEPGVVCESLDGYEDYKPLRGAAQTAEEKLLVYIRPFGFQTEKVDAGHQAHLTADGEIRKHGEKAILRQKKKLLEYKPVTPTPPSFIYLKNSISLKGLTPGDYDLTIILHDEIAKGAPATQIIKFKVIPPKYPPEEKEPTQPHVLDSLYAPFLDVCEPDPDNDDDN